MLEEVRKGRQRDAESLPKAAQLVDSGDGIEAKTDQLRPLLCGHSRSSSKAFLSVSHSRVLVVLDLGLTV